MYHVCWWGKWRYLHTCKAETRVSFWWRTCVVYLIVRHSLGRGFRLDDVSCIFSNYRYLLTCKVLGGTRVTTRKCFLRVTCVVYLIVRPLRGRGLRLDDISYILRKPVLFTYLYGLGRDESYDWVMFLVMNLCCLLNYKAFGLPRVKIRWYTVYLEETCGISLLVRPGVRRELRLEHVLCEELVLFT